MLPQEESNFRDDDTQLMVLLTRSVIDNDIKGTIRGLEKIYKRRLKLTDSILRDQQTNATLLHVAILHEAWDVCHYLIVANKDDDLLTDPCWALEPSTTMIYHTEQGGR